MCIYVKCLYTRLRAKLAVCIASVAVYSQPHWLKALSDEPEKMHRNKASLYDTSQFRQILAIKLNCITLLQHSHVTNKHQRCCCCCCSSSSDIAQNVHGINLVMTEQ